MPDANASAWNLLSHDGRLWLVSPDEVIDLGPHAEAIRMLERNLSRIGTQTDGGAGDGSGRAPRGRF